MGAMETTLTGRRADRRAERWPARLWAGRMPLAEAFWWYAMAYGLLVNLIASLASLAAAAVDAPGAVAVMLFLLPLPYNVLVLVGVWRSAGAHGNGTGEHGAHRALLARAAVAAWFVAATVL